LRNTKSKHFVKSSLSEKKKTSFQAVLSDFERDDDDPSSMKGLSLTILGILIALLTILIPSISVLLGKPLSQGNEINFNHSVKKDGS